MDQIKVVVVGDSGVGKTSLLQRVALNNFHIGIQPTVAGMVFTKSIRVLNKRCTVNFVLWDTAGQERYRSISRMYYQDAAAVIIVYNVTEMKSFENAKLWLEEIKAKTREDPIIGLIGNKSDLVIEEKVDVNEAQRFAKEKELKFSLVSAKTGEGILDAFQEIACELLEKNIINTNTNKARLNKLPLATYKKNCCQ